LVRTARQWPISVGGTPVLPGDLVVGDADGVVVIPRGDVPKVLQAAQRKLADEKVRLEEIAQGQLGSRWLNAALRNAGLPTLG